MLNYISMKNPDLLCKFHRDNGPWYNRRPGAEFRGRKWQSYESGFKAPLIARWPGRIPAGSVCGSTAMNIDFFPTLLAIAGLGLPEDSWRSGKPKPGRLDRKVRIGNGRRLVNPQHAAASSGGRHWRVSGYYFYRPSYFT